MCQAQAIRVVLLLVDTALPPYVVTVHIAIAKVGAALALATEEFQAGINFGLFGDGIKVFFDIH